MAKTLTKAKSTTNRKSDSYKVAQKKMLNQTSKGRQLDLKRAPFASQLGIF